MLSPNAPKLSLNFGHDCKVKVKQGSEKNAENQWQGYIPHSYQRQSIKQEFKNIMAIKVALENRFGQSYHAHALGR